jgi:hypothetical protein
MAKKNHVIKHTSGWRVNTASMLQEIVECNPSMATFRVPINIFGKLLAAVGERAAELNDDQLNALMCRLAIYSVADPYSPDYDKDVTDKVISKGRMDILPVTIHEINLS